MTVIDRILDKAVGFVGIVIAAYLAHAAYTLALVVH